MSSLPHHQDPHLKKNISVEHSPPKYRDKQNEEIQQVCTILHIDPQWLVPK